MQIAIATAAAMPASTTLAGARSMRLRIPARLTTAR
jgi:hypothetical protein